MSVYVDVYAQAKIKGVWRSIDFWQKNIDGEYRRVQILTGSSTIAQAVRDIDGVYPIHISQVADEIRSVISHTDDGALFTGDTVYQLPGEDLLQRDFSQPDCCGFFPRDLIAKYKADPSFELWECERLYPDEFQELDKDTRKAYEYFEIQNPFGEYAVAKKIKGGLIDRVNAWNDHGIYSLQNNNFDFESEISLSDTKAIIVIS